MGLREVDRIIDLLNNLYLLASSKFKKLELYRETVNLEKLVQDVLTKSRKRIEEKAIVLEYRGEPDTVVQCDVNLIRRTIENLVENALRYTPAGGTFTVSTGARNGRIQVVMANTSPGATDNMDPWLEPFVRGRQNENERIPGKGLGLFISRYIVRSHGGDLVLESPSKGVVAVTLTLPASS